MHERTHSVAVIAPNVGNQRSDSIRIRKIARIAARRVSVSLQLGSPLVDVGSRAIDEDERCPKVGKGSRHDLANLAFRAYTGQYDG
jgi:hypothetical protein